MKNTYKNCNVKITTTLAPSSRPPTLMHFTPVVEVDCQRFGKHRGIATGKWFSTAESAEQHGMELAREWIDNNVANS